MGNPSTVRMLLHGVCQDVLSTLHRENQARRNVVSSENWCETGQKPIHVRIFPERPLAPRNVCTWWRRRSGSSLALNQEVCGVAGVSAWRRLLRVIVGEKAACLGGRTSWKGAGYGTSIVNHDTIVKILASYRLQIASMQALLRTL